MSTPLCLHQAHLRYVLESRILTSLCFFSLPSYQARASFLLGGESPPSSHNTTLPAVLHSSTPLHSHSTLQVLYYGLSFFGKVFFVNTEIIISPSFQGIATKIIHYAELLPCLSTASHIPFLLPACPGRPETGLTLKLFEGPIMPETVFWLWVFFNINHH